MKQYFLLILFALALGGFASCEKNNDGVVEEQLVVNYNNIAGTWQLTMLNGEEPGDGVFGYMDLTRRAVEDDFESLAWRTFYSYSNIGSATSRHLTGRFRLEADTADRTIITGAYDYDQGYWERDYFISELTSDTMVWTATDDDTIVSVYTRCDGIPAEVL
jgi:hypothetical protein